MRVAGLVILFAVAGGVFLFLLRPAPAPAPAPTASTGSATFQAADNAASRLVPGGAPVVGAVRGLGVGFGKQVSRIFT